MEEPTTSGATEGRSFVPTTKITISGISWRTTRLATALRRRPFSACNKGNRRRLHEGKLHANRKTSIRQQYGRQSPVNELQRCQQDQKSWRPGDRSFYQDHF